MSIDAVTERHLAATSSVGSHSRSARSTAASKGCSLTPNGSRRVVVARQEVALEPLHQRRDERRILAGDRRGDHGGDRRQRDPSESRGPATSIASAIRSISRA